MAATYRNNSNTPITQRMRGAFIQQSPITYPSGMPTSSSMNFFNQQSSSGPPPVSSAPPFTDKSLGPPSFAPVKLGAKGSEMKMPKPPKPPEKPLMPYMRYSRKVWEQVKAANYELKLWEIGKIIGSMWRELPDNEKQIYMDEYESEKIQYNEMMKNYHNSPMYQAYISAKSKAQEAQAAAQALVEDEDIASKRGKKLTDTRISIQPADDEDEPLEDGLWEKHLAASRYHRNHRLINEILSDTIVPDVRTVVTVGRMAVLKRQVLSLITHQKKLELELENLEKNHNTRKRALVESSEVFGAKLKKLCDEKPVFDEDKFDDIVESYVEKLKDEKSRNIINKVEESNVAYINSEDYTSVNH